MYRFIYRVYRILHFVSLWSGPKSVGFPKVVSSGSFYSFVGSITTQPLLDISHSYYYKNNYVNVKTINSFTVKILFHFYLEYFHRLLLGLNRQL